VRVAALYDIHGNLPALDAVLAELAQDPVDAVVCGGDVLWGPHQGECVARLREAGAVCLSGNCERDVLAEADDSSRWCRAQLDEDTVEHVRSWPATIELGVEGVGHVLFCHATPHSDDGILTRNTPAQEVAAALAGVEADVVVCGHTHVQDDRRPPGAARLVNAGSVGLPYQGRPGAFWALLGPAVELRCTPYDVDAALSSLLVSGFPSVGEIFTESLRGEISAESATAHFEARRSGA
jgi:predicted phosphodiesterase